MTEKPTQKVYTLRKRQAGHAAPLRPLPQVSHRVAESTEPSLSPTTQETITTTLHAIQNCLQTASMGLDLMQLTDALDQQNYEPVRRSVDHAGQFLLELREYCSPSEGQRWTANLAETIENVVQEVARECEQPGQATRVVCHDPKVVLEMDWRQIAKTLRRTIFCAYAMLPPEGGEVVVEARTYTMNVQRFLDIRVRSYGAVSLSVEEETLFSPFTSLNGHQLGLNLVLAQLTANRLGGHLLFHKLNSQQGCFKLRFRI